MDGSELGSAAVIIQLGFDVFSDLDGTKIIMFGVPSRNSIRFMSFSAWTISSIDSFR